MKLTIIRNDGAVYKDGKSYVGLDLSSVPTHVHALQFNDSLNTGWIEFVDTAEGSKPANEIINLLPSWAIDAVNQWDKKNSEKIIEL